MVNCPFCGKELEPPTTKFCSSCGSKIPGIAEEHEPTTLPTQKLSYVRPKPS